MYFIYLRMFVMNDNIIIGHYEKHHCHIAGNFFPTARALIGYFEVI